MSNGPTNKEVYHHLRALPWEKLWTEEVPRFTQASPRERFENVSVIRAVGVVFPQSGPTALRAEVQLWLRELLLDPEEKIRRYAIAALPKVGATGTDEAELLKLLRTTKNPREEKFLGQALDKIGGSATLETIAASGRGSLQTIQKIQASLARRDTPSTVRLDHLLPESEAQRIHLRCRAGLEGILRAELEEQGKFRIIGGGRGLVAVTPLVPITLADIFALRCFGTLGIVLGLVRTQQEAQSIESLAQIISSPATTRLLLALTEGSLRYRLDFIGRGHQRSAVRLVANRAYALSQAILNDPREAPWAIDVHQNKSGDSVELRPRTSPDPRHPYRLGDVPAASHPPLAAAMARLAGAQEQERIWDPFCGSGLELIERSLQGGVESVFGTDRNAQAIAIAERNFAAATLPTINAHFICSDFRDWEKIAGLTHQSLSLIVTNPPLGRRVRVPNLRSLFHDLFCVAAEVLRPGGRMVLTNPFQMDSPTDLLRLQSRQVVDLGGFDCQLEVYKKTSPRTPDGQTTIKRSP